jgi:hypothetical protein
MKVLERRRARTTRLDFDGGPWLRGFPLSWSSPWAELGAAAAVGFAAGLTLFPDPAPIRVIGTVGWLLAAPLAGLVALVDWLIGGTLHWPLGLAWLGPLGWAVLSVAIADLLQATLPLTFGRRVLASAAAAPALGFALVAGLSLLPWQHLPWAG